MNWLITRKHKQGLLTLAPALIAFILGISCGRGECAYGTAEVGAQEGGPLSRHVCLWSGEISH